MYCQNPKNFTMLHEPDLSDLSDLLSKRKIRIAVASLDRFTRIHTELTARALCKPSQPWKRQKDVKNHVTAMPAMPHRNFKSKKKRICKIESFETYMTKQRDSAREQIAMQELLLGTNKSWLPETKGMGRVGEEWDLITCENCKNTGKTCKNL
jgi:hypothetical protein